MAEALESAALAELHARKPDRVPAGAPVPADLFSPMFACARVAA